MSRVSLPGKITLNQVCLVQTWAENPLSGMTRASFVTSMLQSSLKYYLTFSNEPQILKINIYIDLFYLLIHFSVYLTFDLKKNLHLYCKILQCACRNRKYVMSTSKHGLFHIGLVTIPRPI